MAEIIIEIADKLNRNHVFGPTDEKLRGRWSMAGTAGRSSHQSLADLMQACLAVNKSFIPGIRLAVDVQNKRLRRFDPLATEEFADLWKKMDRIMKAYPGEIGVMAPWKEVVKENASNNDIKNWLFYMRRAVDEGHAEVVSTNASLPTEDAIRAMPGARRVGYGGVQFVADKDMWADQVDGKGKPVLEPAGAGDSGGKS